jgi:hypothetical protein
MSLAESLDEFGVLPTRFIPNLRILGYTNENLGSETPHVLSTRSQLQTIQNKITALENGGGNLSGLTTRVNTLESNFTTLEAKVNAQSLLIEQLLIRLNYADNYLKMIDEAISIEGFNGWSPPDFS